MESPRSWAVTFGEDEESVFSPDRPLDDEHHLALQHGVTIGHPRCHLTPQFLAVGPELSNLSSEIISSSPPVSMNVSMTQELSTELDPQLRRGVHLTTALAGFGKHWVKPASGQFAADAGAFELSVPSLDFDAFLSHDWKSSGRLKVLCLHIIFNSQAAFCTSLAVSVLVGVLRAYDVVPDETWTVVFSHLSFYFVFAFWQNLRRLLLCRPLVVFMDRLCIAQHDAVLKQRGIQSLAGFLLASRELVVLWSPEYFNRLWCMFEVATFLKDPANLPLIHFMPLKTGAVLALSAATWQVMAGGYHLITVFRKQRETSTMSNIGFLIPSGIMLALAGLVVPIVYYLGLGFMRDLQELPKQLSDFRVQEASCSCCEMQHVDRSTGRSLMCDRRLIFKMLNRWYGEPSQKEGNEEGALQAFNGVVRRQLAPRVMSKMAGGMVPVKYTVYMVGAGSVPFLADYIAEYSRLLASSGLAGSSLGIWTLRHFADWAFIFLVSLFATSVSIPLWRGGIELMRRGVLRSRLAALALITPCGFLLVSMQFMSYVLAKAATSELSLWPLAPLAVTGLSTLWLFAPSRNGDLADAGVGYKESEVDAPEPQVRLPHATAATFAI